MFPLPVENASVSNFLVLCLSSSIRSYLERDVCFSGEQADLFMQRAIVLTLSAAESLKRLVFVGNLFESLKVRYLNLYVFVFLDEHIYTCPSLLSVTSLT